MQGKVTEVSCPKAVIQEGIPDDWERFISGLDAAKKLLMVARYLKQSDPDIRWYFDLKIRAYRSERKTHGNKKESSKKGSKKESSKNTTAA